MREAVWIELGRMEYSACLELQRQLARARASAQIPDTLLFVEHDPVYSLGANFHEEHLLHDSDFYREKGISVQSTDRGGDVTYHGPNQLVIYPIFEVKSRGGDLHKWLRDLEEATIRTVNAFGLDAYRFPPHTGVWVRGKKIAAIGIKVSKWVNTHGIALNCDNDLSPFEWIVPCGIEGFGVTSLSEAARREITRKQALSEAIPAFEEVFELRLNEGSLERLELIAR